MFPSARSQAGPQHAARAAALHVRALPKRSPVRASRPRSEGMNRGPEGQSDERALVGRCVAGEAAAVAEFQQRFGPLVYSFPMRVYRAPVEEAGDFYVFVFEDGRLFRRLRTFAGRVSLRKYLLGFALDHLWIEWVRGRRELDTVSIELLKEQNPHFDIVSPSPSEESEGWWGSVLDSLPPQKSVVAKLLHVEDAEFSPAEIRYLCAATGKRVPELLREIEELRRVVREREAQQQALLDRLDSVHAWIELYRKRLRWIEANLAGIAPASPQAEKLEAEKAELTRKLAWRQQQREKLCTQVQRRKTTAPYKEMARILNTTVGNVASLVQRVRQEIAERLRARDGELAVRKGGSR